MMKGYLMKELQFIPGEDNFIESFSPENRFGVVFEDDGDTAYFYALEKDPSGGDQRILDALHIYETEEGPEPGQDAGEKIKSRLLIIWSTDWQKCALVINGHCHALFNFQEQNGCNINEFPPPNEFWTKGDRKLTDEMIRKLF